MCLIEKIKSPRFDRYDVIHNFSLEDFKRFLKVDLALSKLTVIAHISKMRNFLSQLQKPIATITKEDVRSLKQLKKSMHQPAITATSKLSEDSFGII